MISNNDAKEILAKEYHIDNYEYLINELLLPDYRRDKHPTEFDNDLFSSVTYLGESSDCEVSVFEVYLKEGCHNKRVAITQAMFRILRNQAINNALVAFVNEDKKNFRISLLTSKYEVDGNKIVKVLSNPRRFSYSLGYKTKTKTAYKFLISKGKVSSLDELISRFSVEVVNKEFYTEIATAFTELVGGNRNGKKYEKQLSIFGVDEHSKYAEFGVRLIGRIMFCWFLKEKHSTNGISLVPKDWLSRKTIESNGSYYHQTLEPLFFELLNTPHNRRKSEYLNEEADKVPYLNGGLFSPHDDDRYEYEPETHAGKRGIVEIPNTWFQNLYNVLNEYNFTVDENTAYDIELSIDPEMLGRIFENLLAEINPETGENVKKSTGSFYTPREIVDYMVDSSICEYLKRKTGISEDRINALISYGINDEELAVFDNNEKRKLIESLYTVTVLDPACGSGAYPIGMLQKIVYLLEKLDPGADLWFDKVTENVSIFIKKEFEKKFNSGSLNYIRKLGVIQNSIFGIDIQPIAVEISRLRCFLSLIIEERVNDDEENRGINPLPSLEFKFIIANSLKSLPNETEYQKNADDGQMMISENIDYIKQLKNVREEYFNAEYSRRKELKSKFQAIQLDMATFANERQDTSARNKELFSWRPFQNKSTNWFDPEWMFGIKDGFDIIIGNPPYGLINKKQNQKTGIKVSEADLEYYKSNPLYKPAKGGMLNIYRLFICKSHYLLKENGYMSLIFPMAFLCDLSAAELRKFVLNQESIVCIEAFPERDDEKKRVFQSAKMSVCILGSQKNTGSLDRKFKLRINDDRFVNSSYDYTYISSNDINCIDSASNTIPLVNQMELSILLKMCQNSKRLKEYSKCYTGEIDLSLDKKYVRLENNFHKMLRGAQVQRFYLTDDISQGDILYLDSDLYLSEVSSPRSKHHSNQRIVMQGITGVNERYRLKMAISPKGIFCANSVNYLLINENIECFLGILNSNLLNWFFKKLSTNSNVNGYEVDNLPITMADSKTVLKLKKHVIDLLSSSDLNKAALEKTINMLVYSIYRLTDEEIELVENSI